MRSKKIKGIIGFLSINLIFPLIVAKVQNINFTNAFLCIWNKIFEFTSNILTFSIPVWVIFLVIVFLVIILKIYSRMTENQEDESWYKDYSSDTYRELLYEWRYCRNGNQIEMRDITPICKECEGNLVEKDIGTQYVLYCPNCGIKYKEPNRDEYKSAEVYFNNKLKKIVNEYNEKIKKDYQK